ncbi:hypothetical protein [Nostoc sp.]|uniref:hypothetical protein n=1 Tax=Nostoc sp. TaxID=1180 RepID=UPI002FFBB197
MIFTYVMILTDHWLFPHAPCPMPNAPCPMPHAQCPMPNAPCPMPHAQNVVISEQNYYLISERNTRLYGIRSKLIKVKIFE